MGLKELIFGGNVQNFNEKDGAYSDSVQKWLPIQNVINGVIVTKDRQFIKVLEVLPVNFYLKSPIDQQNIIYQFASYLKIAPDTLQILIVTQKADTAEYIAFMRRCYEEEDVEACREMIEDNIAEVSFVASSEAITHRFFIAFPYEQRMKARASTIEAIAQRLNEETDTARRYLEMCGLDVLEPEYSDNATLEILYELINKQTSRRVKLPPGVFDMLGEIHGVYQ